VDSTREALLSENGIGPKGREPASDQRGGVLDSHGAESERASASRPAYLDSTGGLAHQ